MNIKEINNKSIEILENDYWTSPGIFPTELVKEVFGLRKKKIKDLTSNEIRILISQKIGLKYMVPKAIDILKTDIFHEAFYYPGDLLSAILSVDDGYWIENPEQKTLFGSLLKEWQPLFEGRDESDEIKQQIEKLVNRFLQTG